MLLLGFFFLKPRLRDLPSYGRTLSGLYPLGLLSAVRIVIGLLLPLQHCPCLSALYQVLVHRANLLPPASFRFRLTADTLAFGCNLPTIRAVWGLAPVRVRSCWANKEGAARKDRPFCIHGRLSPLMAFSSVSRLSWRKQGYLLKLVVTM